MKKLLAILLALAMVFSMAACTSGGGGTEPAPADGGDEPATTGGVVYEDGFPENVLRITYQAEPESADPACTTADYILMMNCMDTLVRTETNAAGENETVPSVADSWEVSEDGLTYSFHLRDDVKFHNGEGLTSDDVLYTVDRMLDPERAAVNTSWMDMIKGAQAVLDGEAESVEGVGIIIKGDYDFDIVLESAYAPFLPCLSTPAWSLCNREAGEAADEAGGGAMTSLYGSDPEYFCGSGPFMLDEWVLNDHVFLKTNPDYWRGANKMEGILIRIIPDPQTEKMLFDAGQLDIFDLDHALDQIPVYRDDPAYANNLNVKTVLGTSYLSINSAIEPFTDARVRKAFQLAIDRQTLIDTQYYGAATPAGTFLAPGVPGYNPDLGPIPYDPEEAKRLLAEAGYPDGFEMEIVQTTDSSTSDIEVNDAISAYLEEVGIHVNIKQMDSASWYDLRATGGSPTYRTSWTADFNDPDNFLYQMYGSSSNKRRSWNYQNQDAIDRLEAARYMVDPEAREAEYAALDELITREDAAMCVLWHKQKIRVLQSRVKGFVPMWAGYGDSGYYETSLELGE